jgi:phosphomannomutase
MSKIAHKFNSSIFREYDIRGTYGKTLHDKDVYWIGRAYAAMLPQNTRICVAFDGRHSSPAQSARLIDGLADYLRF